MRKLATLLGLLAVFAVGAHAQQGSRQFTANATTHVTPDRGIGNIGSGIAFHQLSWNTVGDATGCMVKLQQSTDDSSWSDLITDQACSTTGQSAVVNVSTNYIRINVDAFTGTGSVVVLWNGFNTNPSGGGGSVTGCTTTGGILIQDGTTNEATCNASFFYTGTPYFTFTGSANNEKINFNSGGNNSLLVQPTIGFVEFLINNGSGVNTFAVGGASALFQVSNNGGNTAYFFGNGNAGSIVIVPNAIQIYGTSSGMGAIGVAPVAGTPCEIYIPVTSPSAGTFLNSAAPSSGTCQSTWDPLLVDNGTILTYTGAGGIAVGPDGVHPGLETYVGNTTAVNIPANTFGIEGPNVATFTQYGWQVSSTAPTANQVAIFGTPDGTTHLSQLTYGSVTSLVQLLTGCNTATFVYTPQANDCVAPSSTSISFPQTVAGTTTSGGIPYFSNTTTLTSSALLATGALVMGGGAGGAPATGNADFTYATHTLTGGASGILDLSAEAPTAGLKLPSAAGAVPTADGFIGVNTTTHALVTGSNGTTIVQAAAATGTNTATTCSNQFVRAVSSVAIPTCASIASADLPSQYKTLTCEGGLGDGLNAIAAGTYLQSTCYNGTGVTVTITGVKCFTDNGGTSTLNAAGNTLGALLTGAVTCTASFAAGSQSANVALTSGDYIKFTFVADGTSKQTDWVVTGTY